MGVPLKPFNLFLRLRKVFENAEAISLQLADNCSGREQ